MTTIPETIRSDVEKQVSRPGITALSYYPLIAIRSFFWNFAYYLLPTPYYLLPDGYCAMPKIKKGAGLKSTPVIIQYPMKNRV